MIAGTLRLRNRLFTFSSLSQLELILAAPSHFFTLIVELVDESPPNVSDEPFDFQPRDLFETPLYSMLTTPADLESRENERRSRGPGSSAAILRYLYMLLVALTTI